jgi:bifunctional non-homologous end joining protein LigD
VQGASRPGLFVVHKHAATRLHYDLRLEWGGVLVSFAVPRGPSLDPDEKRLAVHVENHPVEYADFEGVIPADNYGAGPSIVWDRGAWVNIEDPKHGLEQGKLLFDLYGHKLRGRWTLVKLKNTPKEWLLIKKPDAHARKGEMVWPEESIYSGVTVEHLADVPKLREALRAELEEAGLPKREVDPHQVELMLAETAEAPFSKKGWLFELKYDGYRVIGAKRAKGPALRYRKGSDATATFPEVGRALAGVPYALVLDGELVILEPDGRPSFHKLQQRSQLKRRADIDHAYGNAPATLFAFDLLALEGFDLRGLPLTQRKEWLRRVLPPLGPIRFADHVLERGAELYAEARKLGLEGVMGKKADAPYKAGRRDTWLKMRGERHGDFAVVGFSDGSGGRTGFGALDVAVWEGTRFKYAGAVGTGFSEEQLKAIRAQLDALVTKTRAFEGEPMPGKKHTWVEPKLVVEVAFMDWTPDGNLRQPKLLRLRDDKLPKECIDGPLKHVPASPAAVEPVKRKVVVSNPKKVLWPKAGHTKSDLVDYYRAICPWLLPYLKDRPVVLTRYPDGIEGKNFFQKDAPPFTPDWLRTVRVWSEGTQRDIDYFICDDADSVAYLATLATIPLHVWNSRVDALQSPDWSIIDLDPKGAPFKHVVALAKAIHALCEALELPSYVKTSGSSGLHVLLPLGAQCSYAESKGVAELISRVVAAEHSDIGTIERVIEARRGRVYLDYLQNGHGKLLAAPFSVRPLPEAPVSMPLEWKEVNEKNHPRAFTLDNAVQRMKKKRKDPMAGVLTDKVDLAAVVGRLGERLKGKT